MYNGNEENNEHKRLGKGLSALLGERSGAIELQKLSRALQSDGTDKGSRVIEIAVTDIEPSPYQPRKIFNQEQIEELAKSISENGLLQPIIVRQGGKTCRYTVVAGERRLRAVKFLQQTVIKAIVREFTEKQMATLAILENIQREDLSVLEEAEGYAKLINGFHFTQDDIAKSLGRSRSYIANTIRLLALPEEVRQALIQKEISSGHARALLTAKDPLGVLQKIKDEDLSVRAVEDYLRKERYIPAEETKDPAETTAEAKNVSEVHEGDDEPRKSHYNSQELNSQKSKFAFLHRIETILTEKTGLEVKATYSSRQQSGKIVFSYKDTSDLERLLHTLEPMASEKN